MSDKYQDNVQRVLNTLKDVFGSQFATYYDGDPEAIPLFNLPAIIVTQTGDDTSQGSMGEDDITDRLMVKIVLNKKDDWDGDKVDPLNMTERKIRDWIGKRDEATGDYSEQSVKHAVRTLAFDGIEAVANTMTVEYGINPRPVGEGFADRTAEGHVSFTVQWAADTY